MRRYSGNLFNTLLEIFIFIPQKHLEFIEENS